MDSAVIVILDEPANANDLILMDVATEADNRFRRFDDRAALVTNAVTAAKEILSARPMVTDYIAELAIGRSLSLRTVA